MNFALSQHAWYTLIALLLSASGLLPLSGALYQWLLTKLPKPIADALQAAAATAVRSVEQQAGVLGLDSTGKKQMAVDTVKLLLSIAGVNPARVSAAAISHVVEAAVLELNALTANLPDPTAASAALHAAKRAKKATIVAQAIAPTPTPTGPGDAPPAAA